MCGNKTNEDDASGFNAVGNHKPDLTLTSNRRWQSVVSAYGFIPLRAGGVLNGHERPPERARQSSAGASNPLPGQAVA